MKPHVVNIHYAIEFDGCCVTYSDGSKKQFQHSRLLEVLSHVVQDWRREATRAVDELERENPELLLFTERKAA